MTAFIDLTTQQARLKPQIDEAMARVLAHGQYILGPEVAELESRLAEFAGARHCITCANGTDALQLALMALGIGRGDAVFCPSFTFAATAEVVPVVGATPVFTDVDAASFNMSAESLARAVEAARARGLRPAAVIPVDLFGLPADRDAIAPVAEAEGMAVIIDSAQGFGAQFRGQGSVTFGDIATTSFFPAKPLGCYGDGGAVFTADDALAEALRSLRVHGKGTHKYDNVRIGLNSRLDTLQAAILLVKLSIYGEEIAARQAVARRYHDGLAEYYSVPPIGDGNGTRSVWAQYTLKARDGEQRDRAMAALKAAGIPSAIYYPLPLHQQTAYRDCPADPAGLGASEDLAARVFSLPMHPYLQPDDQDRVIDVLRRLER